MRKFAIFLLSFLFVACDNFMNGLEVKEELDTAIEYAKAESYSIKVEADEGTGKFIIGEGERVLKVTDSFDVSFEQKKGYNFVKWIAVSRDEKTSRNDCVVFENETELKTNVKIVKGSNDIKIKPLCEFTMDFKSCIPVNNTKSGIERNSQIELTFTNPISQNNDFSKIEITIENYNSDEKKDGSLYFQIPEARDGKILIKSKKDNLIPVEQGELKIVRVTIPKDFKYIGANEEEKEIGSELSYYYTVNYQTCDKLHLVFGVTKDDGGKFKVKNIYDESVSLNYSLGEIDTIIFKPATGYKFIGWEYEDDGHIQLDNANEVINGSTYENGYCSEDNSYAVKIEIFNSSNEDTNFLFKANVQEIPTAKIQITSEYGRISPNGIANYKEGDKVNLFFTADSDYQFIRWRLVDKKTGKEIENQDYVKFEEDEEFNTNFIFEKVDSDIDYLIEPYCELRPKVVSVSPLYDTDGVYRDRRITVMFDTFMDTSSIYYSKEELVELNILSANENLDSETLESGYTLLKDSSNNCYGYWNSNDKNSYRYKNIQIAKRKNLNENLLQYYDAPYFDENDTSKIIIQSNKDNPPPAGTEILVTIGSEMCSSIESIENKTNILLGSKYKWSFYTNGRADSDPPVFNSIDVSFASVNQSSYDDSSTKVSDSIEEITETPKTGIKKYNHKPKNLWLKGDFTDNGSGPASLKWSITKINNKYYPIAHDLEYLSGKIEGDDYKIAGNTVMIGKDSSPESKGILIDYSSINDEGLYRFSVTAADNNGCTTTKNYYFVYDVTPPSNVSSVSNSRTSAERETIKWTNPATADFDHIVIKQYDGSINNNTFTQDSTSVKTATFAGLINQHKYRYEICAIDYCGNESSIKTYQDDTPPSKLTIRYSEGRSERVNVFFTTPNDEDYCITKVSWNEIGGYNDVDETKNRNDSSYKTFWGRPNGTIDTYYFRTYDYSGNYSEYVKVEEMAGAMPGMICYAPGNSADNIFCSKNNWAGKNPIGVVADGSDKWKVKILELGRSNKYNYGQNNGSFCADNTYQWNCGNLWIAGGFNAYYNLTDGLTWWNLVRDDIGYKNNNTPTSIWAYLTEKNKSTAVTWWVPARHEWQYVCWNWKPMCSAFNTLGISNGMYVGDLFYVSTPNYYNNRCNFVGVGTNDGGKLNEYLAKGEWMEMWTTSWKQDKYYRQDYYDKAYVRAMAFIDMH